MPTFDDQFEEEAADILDEHHGETAVYFPKSGGTRDVTVWLDEEGRIPDEMTGLVSREWCIFEVKRNSTAGIDDPRPGDGLRRAGDPDDKMYAFVGDKSDVTPHRWRLRFERNVPYSFGQHAQR
jgi:hypothetical protein